MDDSSFGFDLRSRSEQERLKEFISEHQDHVLVSYSLDAEIRALYSLYQKIHNPFRYGICLRREHLLLANCDRHLISGTVISKTKKIKVQFNPNSDDKKTKYVNLLNALWKFLEVFDEEHAAYKDRLRDICIRANPQELEENIGSIAHYCGMDTRHLPLLMLKMLEELKKRNGTLNWNQILFRGKYADTIAQKVTRGYFVDNPRLVNFCMNRPEVIKKICTHILTKWPDLPTFRLEKGRYVFQSNTVRDFIKHRTSSAIRSVFNKRTKKGILSLESKLFERLYPNKHSLDENDYLQQIYKYNYTASALRGITLQKKTKETETKKLGDFIDSQGTIRPFYNDYGSQSGRSQPSANGYLLLKPAWLRTLLVPPPGHCMIVSDYGKEEVLITAIFAQDRNLLAAYASGDPYTHDGLKCGFLTESMRGTPEWDVMRQMLKQKILSTIYQISAPGLALLLSGITKTEVPVWEAQRHLDAFARTYPDVIRHFANDLRYYKKHKRITLSDGWTMWGSNYNPRSIQNVRIQGTGSVVMRYADVLMEQMGLWVAMTLHDAFYVYSPLLPDGSVNYQDCAKMVRGMRKGFSMAMEYREGHDLITQDFSIIAPGINDRPRPQQFSVDGQVYDIEYKEKYIDKRATEDIEQYQQYFEMSQKGPQQQELDYATNANATTLSGV